MSANFTPFKGGPNRSTLPLLCLGVLTLVSASGCVAPTTSGLAHQDLAALQHDVGQLQEMQEKTDRQVKHLLDSIDSSMMTRNDMIKANVTDLERTIQRQNNDIVALRRRVEELSFEVSSSQRVGGGISSRPALTPDGTPGTLPITDPLANTLSPEEKLQEALRAYHLGNYAKAEADLEALIDEKPTQEIKIQALYWSAESQLASTQYDDAYDTYKSLITSDPAHDLAWKGLERLAQLSLHRDNLEAAKALYTQIANVHPDYPNIDRVKSQLEMLNAGEKPGGNVFAPAPDANSN